MKHDIEEDFEMKVGRKSDREIVEEFEKDANTKTFLLNVIDGKTDLRNSYGSSQHFLDNFIKNRIGYYLLQNSQFNENSPEMYLYRGFIRMYCAKTYYVQLPEKEKTTVMLPKPLRLWLKRINENEYVAFQVVCNYIVDNYKDIVGDYCYIKGLLDIYEKFQIDLTHVCGSEQAMLLTDTIRGRLRSSVKKNISYSVRFEPLHTSLKERIGMRFEKPLLESLDGASKYIDDNRSECVSVGIISYIANSQISNFSTLTAEDIELAKEGLEEIKDYCCQESQRIKKAVKASIIGNIKELDLFVETIKTYREQLAVSPFFEGVVPDNEKEARLKELNKVIDEMHKQKEEIDKRAEEMAKERESVIKASEELDVKMGDILKKIEEIRTS